MKKNIKIKVHVRRMNGQTDKLTERRTYGLKTDRQTDKLTGGWTDRRMDTLSDGRLPGPLDRQSDIIYKQKQVIPKK